MVATFQLNGQEFIALNGGPQFTFSPAISSVVNCETQEEVDAFREKLSEGGEKQQCGWLKDQYGLSGQIVPKGAGDPIDTRRQPIHFPARPRYTAAHSKKGAAKPEQVRTIHRQVGRHL